jgi:5-methylcytosine-specific restriction enzyme subunit McrC
VGNRPVAELTEWERGRFVEGVALDPSEQALIDRLGVDDRLDVEQIAGGVRLSATSWIGVVRLRDVEIRVIPKYAGGDLGVLRMLDYASGLPALARYEAVRTLHTEGANLVDLLGWLLADHTDRIVRAGLLADYVRHDESMAVLRGRLRLMDQVRMHYGRIEQLECSYDEYETNVLENQVLAAALAVARRVCSDRLILARLSILLSLLDTACDGSPLDPASARAVLEYNRRNEHYRQAHAISWLFLGRKGLDDVYAAGRTDSFAFLLDMNQLFEDFVTRLLRDALEPAGIVVHAQRRDRSIVENELTHRPYAAIIPDILLDDRAHARHVRLPVDAKYKLYDARRLEPSDVYQAFFYAYAYHRRAAEAADVPAALLLYPSAKAGTTAALRVRRADGTATARIRAIGVDIPRVLEAIEQRSIWSLPEVLEVRRILGHVASGTEDVVA